MLYASEHDVASGPGEVLESEGPDPSRFRFDANDSAAPATKAISRYDLCLSNLQNSTDLRISAETASIPLGVPRYFVTCATSGSD
jgi:hypothetical protein